MKETDDIDKINNMLKASVLDCYEKMNEIRNSMMAITPTNAVEAKNLMEALDKSASVVERLQPLLRQSYGINDKVNDSGMMIGGAIAAALLAAEEIREKRNGAMKLIEQESKDE